VEADKNVSLRAAAAAAGAGPKALSDPVRQTMPLVGRTRTVADPNLIEPWYTPAKWQRGSYFSLCKVSGCLGHRPLFVPVALCPHFLSPVEPRKEIHQTEVLLFRPDCLTPKTIRAHGLALDHTRGRDFDARSP
jgi:hypothetical protein